MNKLSFYRKKAGFSQRMLAKALSETCSTNFSSSSIAQYETGERKPSLVKAKLIADFFNKSLEDIFFSNNAHETRASEPA